jgi:hypothetical protein
MLMQPLGNFHMLSFADELESRFSEACVWHEKIDKQGGKAIEIAEYTHARCFTICVYVVLFPFFHGSSEQ